MRLRAILLAGIVGILSVLLLGLPSQASDVGGDEADEGPTTVVSGTVRNASDENKPVEGVTITATPDATGEEVEATSDEDGEYEMEVPALGRTVIAIDVDSLPDDVSLAEGAPTELTPVLDVGRPSFTAIFRVGQSESTAIGTLDQLAQNVYNGLYFGIILALGALGLSMIFGTTGLTNFAHGEMVTFGAIMTYTFNVAVGMNIFLSGIIAIALSALFGYLQDRYFWRILRHRGTGLIAMMIVSIGLQFFLRNVFQFFTGGRTENYNDFTTPSGISAGPVTFSMRDVYCMIIAIVLLTVVAAALKFSRVGRAARAISDNPALAASTGINVDRVVTLVWTVGVALAGTCGIILGFSQSVKFDLGAQILLVMFAAITVGGLGSISGAIIGSIIVGVLVETSTLIIPSELKIAAAMFLLIVILLVRPQGLLGNKERIG